MEFLMLKLLAFYWTPAPGPTMLGLNEGEDEHI